MRTGLLGLLKGPKLRRMEDGGSICRWSSVTDGANHGALCTRAASVGGLGLWSLPWMCMCVRRAKAVGVSCCVAKTG